MNRNFRPLIFIQGATATGKTQLSLNLAQTAVQQKFFLGAKLISADSRQVYQGLEVLTGTDIPPNFSRQSASTDKQNSPGSQPDYDFFQHSSLPLEIHGVSIIPPIKDWSVAHFLRLATAQIKTAWSQNYLPIIVGGTGFYHQQLTDPQPTIKIKPNPKLRQQAARKSVTQLQDWLKELDPKKYRQLNQSDQNNPRRLIRAIEVSLAKQSSKPSPKKKDMTVNPSWQLAVGLHLNLISIQNKIVQRIHERLDNNVMAEVGNLSLTDLPTNSPVLSATGTRPLTDFQRGILSLEEAKEKWFTQELHYTKQQLTWLKKYQPDLWLDAHSPNNHQTLLARVCQELNRER